MPAYTQSSRPMILKTPLGPDALLLVTFAGQEGISEPFRYEVEALALRDAPVAFEKLLGLEALVEHRGETGTHRHFHGLVSRIGELGADNTFIRYRLEIVPAFGLLALNLQNRIFQQKSVPEILQQVLHGLDVDYRLNGQYLPHNYCVQYQESDFHYASRLMEEEGIFYYFEHSEKGHKLVLADSSADCPELADPRARYDPEGALEQRGPRVQRWEKFQEVRPGRYTVWDRTFEMPGKHLEAMAESAVSVKAGLVAHDLGVGLRRQLEIFEFPAGYAHRFDGVGPSGQGQGEQLQKVFEENRRLAQVRLQEQAAEGLRIEGGGTCPGFTAGLRFALEGHPHASGDYLLTRVEHSAVLPDFRSESAPGQPYSNRFVSLPRDLDFRPPRRTPRPRMPGAQTATVVGAKQHEVWTDKYGRVKVHFHWDRHGSNDGLDSCWVRVATNWAGKGFGLITLPRVGQEVVVDFLEGDPDQPLITGSVYNADQVTPFDLPLNNTVTALRTQTVQGKRSDFHGLAFDDQQGSEKILLRSQKDVVVSAVNNHMQYVPNYQFNQVGFSRFNLVGGVVATTTVGGENGNNPPPENGSNPPPENGPTKEGDELTVHRFDRLLTKDNEPEPPETGEKPWGFEVGVKLEPVPVGMAMGTTYGVEVGLVGGYKSYFDSIASVECVVDPLTFLAGLAGYKVPRLGAGLSGFTGDVKIVYGSVSDLHYGPQVEVRRGPVFHSHEEMNRVTKAAAGIHALSVMATIAMPGILGAVKVSEETIRNATAGCFAGATVLQWLLTQLELDLDVVTASLDDAEQALKDATEAMTILNTNTATSWRSQISQRVDTMETNLATFAAAAAPKETFERTLHTNTVAGPYRLTARDILVTALVEGGSTGNFSLRAAGVLNLTSSGPLTAQSTGDNLVLRGQNVNLNCAALGHVQISSADNPIASTTLMSLDEEEIALQFGPAVAPVASVSVSAEGVKLTCGPNSLTISATGISVNGLKLDYDLATKSIKVIQMQIQG